MLNGGVACYLPYECADGWVSRRRAGAEVLAGVLRGDGARRTCSSTSSPRPGRRATREIAEVFTAKTKAEWAAFNDEHDCCIEPVLDLDEALSSELTREREMVVELEQPELGPVRLLGMPSSSRAPPAMRLVLRPRWASTRARFSEAAGFEAGEIDELIESGAAAGLSAEATGSFMSGKMAAPAKELLKISELAERAEVPVATVRHYLREGLLPEPVKTSRNMAYYPPEFVERIRTIKRLQEERFMPLRVIKDALLAERTPQG